MSLVFAIKKIIIQIKLIFIFLFLKLKGKTNKLYSISNPVYKQEDYIILSYTLNNLYSWILYRDETFHIPPKQPISLRVQPLLFSVFLISRRYDVTVYFKSLLGPNNDFHLGSSFHTELWLKEIPHLKLNNFLEFKYLGYKPFKIKFTENFRENFNNKFNIINKQYD